MLRWYPGWQTHFLFFGSEFEKLLQSATHVVPSRLRYSFAAQDSTHVPFLMTSEPGQAQAPPMRTKVAKHVH